MYDKQIVPRQSNFELLRIVAMLMIIAHHYSIHGEFSFLATDITLNRLWTQFLWMGGKIGVNIFVLISGYFLINAPKIKTHKVLKLWLQIFTYAVALFIIFTASGMESFGWKKLLHTLLPISFPQWWFASTYFLLYLLSPFLSKMLNALTKQDYQKLLVLLGVCWCIIPTFLTVPFESNHLIWFVFLYSVAGYIRRHAKNKLPYQTYLFLGGGMLLLIFLSIVVLDILGTHYTIFAQYATYFCGEQRLPAFLASLFLFWGFQKIQIGYKKGINIISSTTFGIYLIHDSNYVRPFLWKTLLQNASYAEKSLLIPHSIIVVCLVFLCCTAIELIRVYLLERNYMSLVIKISTAIDRQIERLFNSRLFRQL